MWKQSLTLMRRCRPARSPLDQLDLVLVDGVTPLLIEPDDLIEITAVLLLLVVGLLGSGPGPGSNRARFVRLR